MNVIIASDDIRRANSRAIARRDRWRDRYATVSTAIRRAKSRLRNARMMGSFELERGEEEVIRALRVQADLLMLYRGDLTIELRETAYRWAPKEALV
jgi:hypothetical protein